MRSGGGAWPISKWVGVAGGALVLVVVLVAEEEDEE